MIDIPVRIYRPLTHVSVHVERSLSQDARSSLFRASGQIAEATEKANKNFNTDNKPLGTIVTSQVNISAEEDAQTPTAEVQSKGPSNRRLRRFSLKKFPSVGDIYKAANRRTKSEVSGMDDSASRDDTATRPAARSPGRIFSEHVQVSLNKRFKATTLSMASKSAKLSPFRMPTLRMIRASQSGYLDKMNKKKKWEKFWCVLQDSCLYWCNSPQSEFTQDAMVLCGYSVSADMSVVQKAKFVFKLEKKGASTYYLRCDNHKSFIQWICMIKKESSFVFPDVSDNEILLNSVKNSDQEKARTQLSKSCANLSPVTVSNRSLLPRRHTADVGVYSIFHLSRRSQFDLELQKEILLREVLEQQKEIIKEQSSISPSSGQSLSYYVPLVRETNRRMPTKNEVFEKYERVKETQQMEFLKSLTQLHRRRNSVQLKIDQLSRETKPNARRSRSISRCVILSMEAKIALLQSELAEIDQEIREQQASKEDIMDNILHKRDLEIMILDQKECLDIVKRRQSNSFQQIRRRSIMPAISSASEPFASIYESSGNCQSDASSTCSGFSTLGSNMNSLEIALPTHLYKGAAGHAEHITIERSTTAPEERDCFRSCQSIAMSKSYSCSSEAVDVASVEGALSEDFRSLSTSSVSDLDVDCRTRVSSSDESLGKRQSEVRPDVLAEIEEFEIFSKMMLQRMDSTNC